VITDKGGSKNLMMPTSMMKIIIGVAESISGSLFDLRLTSATNGGIVRQPAASPPISPLSLNEHTMQQAMHVAAETCVGCSPLRDSATRIAEQLDHYSRRCPEHLTVLDCQPAAPKLLPF
jgi:hypothetical protein